jgi:hypothetical protein
MYDSEDGADGRPLGRDAQLQLNSLYATCPAVVTTLQVLLSAPSFETFFRFENL